MRPIGNFLPSSPLAKRNQFDSTNRTFKTNLKYSFADYIVTVLVDRHFSTRRVGPWRVISGRTIRTIITYGTRPGKGRKGKENKSPPNFPTINYITYFVTTYNAFVSTRENGSSEWLIYSSVSDRSGVAWVYKQCKHCFYIGTLKTFRRFQGLTV